GPANDGDSAKQNDPELIKSPRLVEKPPVVVEKPAAIHGPPLPPRLRVGVLYNLDSRSEVASAVLSLGSKRVLVGSPDTVWLYDLAAIRPDNEPLTEAFRYPFQRQISGRRPLALALTPAGDRVLFGTIDFVFDKGQLRPSCPIVAVWDVRKANLGQVLDGRRGDVLCVAISRGG